ncbi:MAG: UPF0175 family protein [Blastocatellia bacterium]
MSLTLQVPNEVLEAMKLPPAEVEAELLRDLAVSLYQRGILPLGKARLLAQMSRWDFIELLARRGVARHYTEDDLTADIEYAYSHH